MLNQVIYLDILYIIIYLYLSDNNNGKVIQINNDGMHELEYITCIYISTRIYLSDNNNGLL